VKKHITILSVLTILFFAGFMQCLVVSAKSSTEKYMNFLQKVSTRRKDIGISVLYSEYNYSIQNISGHKYLIIQYPQTSSWDVVLVFDCVNGKVKRVKNISEDSHNAVYIYKNNIMVCYDGSALPKGAVVYAVKNGKITKKAKSCNNSCTENFKSNSKNSTYAKKVCKKIGLSSEKFKKVNFKKKSISST
jgi:hypothetical protein